MDEVLDYLISHGCISEDNDKEVSKVKGLYNELMQASDALNIKVSSEDACNIIRHIITSSAMKPEVHSQDDTCVGLLQYNHDTFKYYAVEGHDDMESTKDTLYALLNNTNLSKDVESPLGFTPTGERIIE